jgi:hypothetical protein
VQRVLVTQPRNESNCQLTREANLPVHDINPLDIAHDRREEFQVSQNYFRHCILEFPDIDATKQERRQKKILPGCSLFFHEKPGGKLMCLQNIVI